MTEEHNQDYNNDFKKKQLDAYLKKLEKNGHITPGSVYWGKEKKNEQIDVIPTGSLSLDLALGIGGWPKGRLVEVYGAESVSKTTLGLQLVAQVQKMGGMAGYLDIENALSPEWAELNGVDWDNLLVQQPHYAEEAIRVLEGLVRSKVFDVICFDSVAGLATESMFDTDVAKDTRISEVAAKMSRLMAKLPSQAKEAGTLVYFVNQLREDISPYGGLKTPGGRHFKHAMSIRVRLSPDGGNEASKIKEPGNSENVIGVHFKADVTKNKLAKPYKKAHFSLLFDQGIDCYREAVDLAVGRDVIQKKGAYYYLDDFKTQGKENMIKYFQENPDVYYSVVQQIKDIEFGNTPITNGVQDNSDQNDNNDDEGFDEGDTVV